MLGSGNQKQLLHLQGKYGKTDNLVANFKKNKMNKNTQILLGVAAVAVIGYFVWKNYDKNVQKVLPKDMEVQKILANVDNQMALNEFDDSMWIDLYNQLYTAAEISIKNSKNVSKDVQSKAIEYLAKIKQFQPSVDFGS
jgi:uncharacterized membrane protein YebE (DUF533 family)